MALNIFRPPPTDKMFEALSDLGRLAARRRLVARRAERWPIWVRPGPRCELGASPPSVVVREGAPQRVTTERGLEKPSDPSYWSWASIVYRPEVVQPGFMYRFRLTGIGFAISDAPRNCYPGMGTSS